MAYIECLFPIPERRDGSLKSRRKIADELNIKQKVADNIHMMMKKAGYYRESLSHLPVSLPDSEC
jgi:hypothetical protein